MSSKGNDHKAGANTGIRRSTDQQPPFINHDELQDQTPKVIRRTPLDFSTHDAILARMRGLTHVEGPNDGFSRGHTLDTYGSESAEGPTSTSASYLSTNYPSGGPKEVLHDPFDGTPLGVLTMSPPHGQQQTPDIGMSSMHVPENTNKDEQWAHLYRVLELQNEVSRMHLNMENVLPGHGKGKGASKRRGRGMSRSSVETGAQRGDQDRRDNAPIGEGETRRDDMNESVYVDVPDEDVEGVDAAGNEEIEEKRAREEQFANLAGQFEGRKETIHGIMSKLDELSKALTEFHALQVPKFEFSKTTLGQDSITPDKTPPLKSKLPTYPSTPLPSEGSKPNKSKLLRPNLPSIQSSDGSLTSATAFPSDRENSVLPASLSRSVVQHGKPKHGATSLIMNALEPGRQTHFMDSPDSIKGNTKLPFKRVPP